MSYNLIQKWIIWNSTHQKFITKGPFHYVGDPSLARIYHNYSDVILACHDYDKKFDSKHHPVELRFHFNLKTLKNKSEPTNND